MPELVPADVELFTDGRLLASDVETNRALQRAYETVRGYCHWHVSPSRIGDVVTLDGPGGRLLSLPTLKLTTLTSVVEDGVSLNIADLLWSVNGLVRKKSGSCWSSKYRSIVVTMTHGFAEAKDFDQAVLELVDFTTSRTGEGGLRVHKVDDENREWFSRRDILDVNTGLLARYRIMLVA